MKKYLLKIIFIGAATNDILTIRAKAIKISDGGEFWVGSRSCPYQVNIKAIFWMKDLIFRPNFLTLGVSEFKHVPSSDCSALTTISHGEYPLQVDRSDFLKILSVSKDH